MTDEFMRLLAQYARAHGLPRPDTKDGMDNLVALYVADQMAQQEILGAREGRSAAVREGGVHLISDGGSTQIADPIKEGIYEDDWNRLLRDRAKASIGPNGEVLDDFDTEFQLLGQERKVLNEIAPFTRTNPATSLGGSLGGQATAVLGADPLLIANWIGDETETMPVTVTIAPVNVLVPEVKAGSSGGLNATPGYVRPYAIVQFGTKGFQVKSYVDIGLGCQFTVGASSVAVSVGLERSGQWGGPIVTPIIGSPIQTQILAGMLSFNATQRTTRITRTMYGDAVAIGDNVQVTVPPFAKNVTVERGAGAACTVNVYDGSFDKIAYRTYATANNPDVIALASDAQQMVVTNDSGALAQFRIIFELSF